MNLITILIIVILAAGCLVGWYKGFLNTLCNIVSFFLAWLIAFALYVPLSSTLISTGDLEQNLLYFTAGAEKLSDMTVANVDSATLSAERIHEIISTSNIPPHISGKLETNILNQAFYDQGISTMSDYFNQTLINFSLNLICFLLIYFVVRLICSFVIELLDKTFTFPILKRGDSAIGAAFGLLFGFMVVTIIFSILPIVFTVIDLPSIQEMVETSWLGNFFYSNNIISGVLSGSV